MDPEQIPIRDLHLPEAVSWWPLAPGWYVVIAALLVVCIYLLRLYLQHRSRGAARRHAMRELAGLTADFEKHGNAVAFSSGMSELLRRTMLAYAPRSEVAGLTGEPGSNGSTVISTSLVSRVTRAASCSSCRIAGLMRNCQGSTFSTLSPL
jgi:hypothetical protein